MRLMYTCIFLPIYLIYSDAGFFYQKIAGFGAASSKAISFIVKYIKIDIIHCLIWILLYLIGFWIFDRLILPFLCEKTRSPSTGISSLENFLEGLLIQRGVPILEIVLFLGIILILFESFFLHFLSSSVLLVGIFLLIALIDADRSRKRMVQKNRMSATI